MVNELVLGQQLRQCAALALKQFDDRVADLVDLAAVEALEHRTQSAQQRIEVERRLGVGPGDRAAGRQLAQFARARGDFEVAVADQVLVADHRARRGVELVALVDVEGDVDGVVGRQFDLSTVPTGTPAMRTSSPVLSREASWNCA